MENSRMKIIECEGFQIAVLVEADSSDEHPIYYPGNFLIYIEHGTLNLYVEDKKYSIKQNQFGFIRKYTHGKFVKTWKEGQKGFKEHIFVLHDAFIKEVIRGFSLPDDFMPCTVPVVNLKHNLILKGLMNSVEVYVSGEAQLDRDFIQVKTKEALHGILKSKPELIHILNDFSEPARADIVSFMEHNFVQNLSLDQFAMLSGRSLSTFTRDFKKQFNTSPHKWIKQKRLELALKLLLQTPKKASDIYLEVGFEDLAHFSKSFKNHFGQNPSEIKTMAMD